MNITDFSCDGIAAANGPCIFAFTASFTLIGGTVTRCFGFDEANQAAAVYLDSDGWGSLTDVHFISNRLHPLNSAQKGAAIYMLASELVMNRVSFFNHSSIGNGGSVYAESLSLITAKDINVTYSKALTGLGGFLYADDSSVTINGITASHCKAVPDSSSGGGQGGVIAANAGYKLILKNGYYYDNEANQGGAIYINQLFDSPVVTTTDDYFGAQIYDSVFERNNATIGGAIYGKQSIFYATRSRFTNNFATTFEGSAIFMATDTILQFSTVETSIESYSNATMIEAVRLALDNSTVSTNMGFGIKLSSDTGDEDTNGRYRDKTYYILSRNSDLSGTRITDSLGNGYWATLSCLDSSGDREEWYPENTIPSLGSAGVTFQPACPTSAQCVEDSDLKTMLCTCDSSSFHSNIYNSDGSCLDSGATLAPSPLPTVTGGNDDVSGTDDTSSLANTTYAITDNSKVLNVGFDMSTDVMILLYASLGLLGLVLFLSSAVDCAKFEGASEDSLQDRTLFVMSKVPALFHLLLCTNRKHWVDLVVAYEDVVEVEQESSNPLSGKKGRKKEGRKSTRKRRTKKGKDLADEHSPFATGDGTQAPKRKTKKETAGEHQSLL
jgi:hypothetical protein